MRLAHIPILFLVLLAACAAVTREDLELVRAELRQAEIPEETITAALAPIESKLDAQEAQLLARIQQGGDAIPSPFGDLLAAGIAVGYAYIQSKREGSKAAEKAAEKVNEQRDKARLARGESVGLPGRPPGPIMAPNIDAAIAAKRVELKKREQVERDKALASRLVDEIEARSRAGKKGEPENKA